VADKLLPELTADEQAYAVDMICRWIEADLATSGRRAALTVSVDRRASAAVA
jgi:hypothetical protein